MGTGESRERKNYVMQWARTKTPKEVVLCVKRRSLFLAKNGPIVFSLSPTKKSHSHTHAFTVNLQVSSFLCPSPQRLKDSHRKTNTAGPVIPAARRSSSPVATLFRADLPS